MLSKKFLCLLMFMASSSSSWGMLTVLRAKQTGHGDEKPSNGPLIHKRTTLSTQFSRLDKDSRPIDMPLVRTEQPLFNAYSHKCKEIEKIAEQSQDNQKVYASYYCQTPEGQQKFMHAIDRVQKGEATSLQVLKEIEKAKELGAYAKRREASLIDEDSQKKNNTLGRFKQMVLPSPAFPALDKKDESAYLSTAAQQAVLKKMYAHFDGTGNTEITLSTPEWFVVQSLPQETKRNFRSLDEFYTAHRMPTEDEQLFYVIGNAGQGACIGAGLIMPYAVMKQFGNGVQTVVSSKKELCAQIKDQCFKSLEDAAQGAIVQAERIKEIPFQEPEDVAARKIFEAGINLLTHDPKEFLGNLITDMSNELVVPALAHGFQNVGLSAITDPSVVAAAVVGGSIGAVNGLRGMNKPCETQNISKI